MRANVCTRIARSWPWCPPDSVDRKNTSVNHLITHAHFLALTGDADFMENVLTLNLLTTTMVAPPNNASKWQMGFNSAFKGLNNECLAYTVDCQYATAAPSGRHLSKLYWRNREGIRKNNDNGVGS
jgi:hypothetical protein